MELKSGQPSIFYNFYSCHIKFIAKITIWAINWPKASCTIRTLVLILFLLNSLQQNSNWVTIFIGINQIRYIKLKMWKWYKSFVPVGKFGLLMVKLWFYFRKIYSNVLFLGNSQKQRKVTSSRQTDFGTNNGHYLEALIWHKNRVLWSTSILALYIHFSASFRKCTILSIIYICI